MGRHFLGGAPNSWPNFINSGHCQTRVIIWWRATSECSGAEKKQININSVLNGLSAVLTGGHNKWSKTVIKSRLQTFLLADFDRRSVQTVVANAGAGNSCYAEFIFFAFIQVWHGGTFSRYWEVVDFLPVASGLSLLYLITYTITPTAREIYWWKTHKNQTKYLYNYRQSV